MKKALIAYGIVFVLLVGLFVYLDVPLYYAIILTVVGMAIQWFSSNIWPL